MECKGLLDAIQSDSTAEIISTEPSEGQMFSWGRRRQVRRPTRTAVRRTRRSARAESQTKNP